MRSYLYILIVALNVLIGRVLLIALLSEPLYGYASDSNSSRAVPSMETIQTWWKLHSDEEMKIEGDLVEIRLRSKEIAFLAPVGFYSRGRNFIWHAIMIRPDLREVREIDEPVRRDLRAYDLDHDGISEVVAVSLGSGQGTTEGADSIVQFDGWSPVILHQTAFHDNLGACGRPPGGEGRCVSVYSNWKFKDLDGDGISDLLEEVTMKSGIDTDSLKVRKRINRYVFKNNKFTLIKNAPKGE